MSTEQLSWAIRLESASDTFLGRYWPFKGEAIHNDRVLRIRLFETRREARGKLRELKGAYYGGKPFRVPYPHARVVRVAVTIVEMPSGASV